MAEFTRNTVQTVQPNSPILLDTSIGCPKGYVYHRPGSGIVTLRGIVNNPCSRFARYKVFFKGNIALAEGSAVGPIAVAITIDGEPDVVSTSISTPAAVGDFNVAVAVGEFNVPAGCCWNIAVENILAPSATGTVAPAIDVQNAVLTVTRTA